MNWSRMTLKTNAKIAFFRNYWVCVGVAFVAMMLISAVGNFKIEFDTSHIIAEDGTLLVSIRELEAYLLNLLKTMLIYMGIMFAYEIIVGNIVKVGISRYFMENREHKTPFFQLFYGFTEGRYLKTLATTATMTLRIFLWTLLFIVPGLLKSYSYRMVPYLVAENPDMDRKRALQLSEQMMYGHRAELFVLDLSFIGWYILGTFTMGFANILMVEPYVQATMAEYYTAMRSYAFQQGMTNTYELPGVSKEQREWNAF